MKSFQLALVTGASTGLGKALCQALAARGIPLILAARNEENLKQVAKSLSVPTHIYPVDLTHPHERQKFLEWLQEKAPDLIINNAGSGLYGPALSHTTLQQSEMLELNMQALLEITLECARTLLNQKKTGTILNISSVAGFFLYPSHCVYAASKACVNTFSQSLDFELKPHKIRILASCPGMIDTDFSFHSSGGTPHKKSTLLTMSPEKTAQLILKQIDSGKAIEIIDWRYKCFYALSKFLPKSLKMRLMNATLKSRHLLVEK
jgi:short-subunit dehydrogenase